MATPTKSSSDLTLHQLSRRWIFRVSTDFSDGAVLLCANRIYRVVSTMADSGRTIIIEEVIPAEHATGNYTDCWDETIRIGREAAKAIAVYRIR